MFSVLEEDVQITTFTSNPVQPGDPLHPEGGAIPVEVNLADETEGVSGGSVSNISLDHYEPGWEDAIVIDIASIDVNDNDSSEEELYSSSSRHIDETTSSTRERFGVNANDWLEHTSDSLERGSFDDTIPDWSTDPINHPTEDSSESPTK